MKQSQPFLARGQRRPTPAVAALSLALLSPLTGVSAFAQIAPDAGQTLQQELVPLEAPKPSQDIRIEAPRPAATPAGGEQIEVQTVTFSGNTLFSQALLLGALGPFANQSYDLRGLRGLAERISEYYRQAGYPFARAYLPPQPMDGGILRIEVQEGKYGQVKAVGERSLATGALAFLSALKPGSVIESNALERITLIVSDQPGIKSTPIIAPGQAVGSADLGMRVERSARYTGEVGLDNGGNRYTGQTRAHLNLDANSPFLLGDQLTLRSLLSEESMWFGNLAYSLPLGASGLRGQVGYSHTYYELAKDFANLQASGTAKITSLALSYPIVRSQQANLNVSGTWLHKELNDRQGATGTSSDKSSDTVPLSLGFDMRDGLGAGGITYGNFVWTSGLLQLDSTLTGTDQVTAKTAGQFDKINLDLTRVQSLSGTLSLLGRFSGQWASKNLDSSEGFGLGGPSGVRAYPVGEAYGDGGWLAQVEVRYTMGDFTPYAFYDAGGVKTNTSSWTSQNNERSIDGAGFGSRYQKGKWSLDIALAWRNVGGPPQSDTQDNQPRAWLTMGYKF